MIFSMIGMANAAEVVIPEKITPGQLFVIRITPTHETDSIVVIESEPGKVQFMGAVQGTPDIQMRSDSVVEIEPKSGVEQCYELKYLAMGAEGSSGEFSVRDSSGTRKIAVSFIRENETRNYSWFILAGGILLLIIGLKLWRYQKSSPSMMSTKSLFMNYEELEKARKMYFDGHSENQNPSAEKSVEQPEIAEKDDAKPTSEKTEERQVPTQASLEPFASSENEQQETLEVSSDGGKTVEDLVITPDSLSTSAMPSEKTQPASAAKDQRTSQRQSYSEKIAPSASGTSNALTIELCDESGKVVRGSGESVKVGRRRDNQLVLTGSEISREHVMFFFRDGKVWVKPLTNSNITQVGGKDLKSEVKIESGAMLNLGGTNFQVRVL
jgi:hypothetical protein